ncbi:MAG: DUF2079 domain-containing protein [Thermoplasmataceae archaeon]
MSIGRLYNLYAAVFDLGLSAERLWLPLHSNPGVTDTLYQIFYLSIIPYIFSPISLTNSLKALLVLQSVFIWASVFPLYFISRKLGLSPLLALIISISYFFYYPLAGLNLFDFHMQAFFPFFFLLSYTLYIYGYVKTSFLFFIITALTKFPYEIFIILFSLIELFSFYHDRKDIGEKKSKPTYLILLLLFSLFSVSFGYALSFIGDHFSLATVHSAGGTQPTPLGNLAVTAILILGPVLFLPLYSKKWAPFLLPYFVLVAVTRNPIYFFPDIITDQYSALFVAFIFLGIIDSLSKRKDSKNILRKEPSHRFNIKRTFKISERGKTALSILIFLVLFSIIFQPWSPLVKDNNYVNFYSKQNNPYDSFQTYTYLVEEAKLVPRQNPYVLVPNNIPEAYPRALIGGPQRIGELVMGFPGPVFQNITLEDALNNTYPYLVGNGKVSNIPIDYAWAVTETGADFSVSGYQSIIQIMDIMLESGKYGILAEANGTILLERGYDHPPALYAPLNHFVGPSQGTSSSSILWYGGTNYYPGTYTNVLHLVASPGAYGNISVTAMLNGSIVSEKYVNITKDNRHSTSANVTIDRMISQITLTTGYFYFIVRENGFTGNVTFTGLTVKEVSYQW